MLVIRHEIGTNVTATATAAIEEGHALKVSGAKSVAPAGAGDVTVGVSLHKAAIGEKPSMRLGGDIIPMVAGAAIVAGAELVPGATPGQVITRTAEDAETIIGVAWTAAAAQGDEVLVVRV